jgi:predicted dehydrogenase
MSAPDQVVVSGILSGGAPVSIHYRGGMARDGDGFFWKINGTEGDIRVSGPFATLNSCRFISKERAETKRRFSPWRSPHPTVPAGLKTWRRGNVVRIYGRMAHDLREGTRTSPSFEDAVAVHRVIASIERAAEHVRRT